MKIYSKIRAYYKLCVLLLLLPGCNAPVNRMNNTTYNELSTLLSGFKGNNSLIYYFDGDCSICIGKVKYIESNELKKGEFNLFFIARTRDPAMLKFNTDALKIKSHITIEKNDEYANALKFNEIIMIKEDKVIVPNSYNSLPSE